MELNRPNARKITITIFMVTALVLASCSWPWENHVGVSKRAATDVSVSIAFPGHEGALKAEGSTIEPTPAMSAGAPDTTVVHQVVNLKMTEGSFPASGANVSFILDQPLAYKRSAAIAYWDPKAESWVPHATTISSDRRTFTAKADHFSDWTLIDFGEELYNVVGKLLGDKTAPPTCPGNVPSWADPTYVKDSINNPVLWCVGTDAKNPDIMEVHLKLNGSVGASISTAIKPAWAWSDLWDSLAPVTWAKVAVGAGLDPRTAADQYMIQPLGEYRFGFNKKDLLAYWHAHPDTPLIEVSTSLSAAIAGLMYQAAEGSSKGGMAAVFITTALLQCEGELDTMTGRSVQEALSAVLGCMSDIKEAIINLTVKAWLVLNPNADMAASKTAGAAIGKFLNFFALLYVASKAAVAITAFTENLSLDPVTRQLIFHPSNSEVRAYIQSHPGSATQKVVLDPWANQDPMTISTSAPGLMGSAAALTCFPARDSTRMDLYECHTTTGPLTGWSRCFKQPDGSDFACTRGADMAGSIVKWSRLQNPAINEGGEGGSSYRTNLPLVVKLKGGAVCDMYEYQLGFGVTANGPYIPIGKCDALAVPNSDGQSPSGEMYLWGLPDTYSKWLNTTRWFGQTLGPDGMQTVLMGVQNGPLSVTEIEAGYF